MDETQTLAHPQFGKLAVLDDTDPSLLTVQHANGETFKIGKATVGWPVAIAAALATPAAAAMPPVSNNGAPTSPAAPEDVDEATSTQDAPAPVIRRSAKSTRPPKAKPAPRTTKPPRQKQPAEGSAQTTTPPTRKSTKIVKAKVTEGTVETDE